MDARIRAGAAVVCTVVALAVAGCAPEPVGTTSTSPTTARPTPTPSEPSAVASPTPSSALALPASCESVYSAGMLSTLQSQVPPLNDPGVTLFSTQVARALEVLDSGAPTLRCSWGRPSEFGLATNVTLIDVEQAASVQAALTAEGIACEPAFDGTLCAAERETLDLDDNIVTTGEQHYFADGGWVSTAYIDVLPDGYTEDIARTVWG